jgi:hypothetical protein
MGSCISAQSYKLAESKIEELRIELNMVENRLENISNKLVLAHNSQKFTSRENKQLRSFVVSMNDKYSRNMLLLKKDMNKETEDSAYFKEHFKFLKFKLKEHEKYNVMIKGKYQELEKTVTYYSDSEGVLTNTSTVSSKSFY